MPASDEDPPAVLEDELEAGTPNPSAQQRSSIPSFLFIIFMLWLLTSHNGEEFLARHQYQEVLTSLKYQKSNFTAWANGTESNFTMPERDRKLDTLLPHFLNYTGERQSSSYHRNITAFIHGDATFHNITPSYLASTNVSTTPWMDDANGYMLNSNATNTTALISALGVWNWNTSEVVAFSFVERRVNEKDPHEDPVLVHGRVELTDSVIAQDLRLEFEGVHFISNGTVYGFAEPSGLRRLDIRELPALVPPHLQNATINLIEPELQSRISRVETFIDDGNTEQETSADEVPKTGCPFIFFGQVLPSNKPEYYMKELEEELLHPTGINMSPMPRLSMDAVLISNECGIVFEVKNTEGLRSRAFFRKVTNYAGMVGVMYLALVLLLNKQISHSRTPAGISRVSRWTFFSQGVIDCLSFSGHVTFVILSDDKPGLSLLVPSFLAAVLFMREAQFSMLVGEFQSPEDNSRTTPSPPQPTAPATTTPPVSTSDSRYTGEDGTLSLTDDATTTTYPPLQQATTTNTNPQPILPTTNATPPNTAITTPTTVDPRQQIAPSFWVFFFNHLRRDGQARIWLATFFVFTVMLRLVLTPTVALLFVATIYCCFWLPQIVRSVKKGRSSGLRKDYVIGVTVARLSIFLYFFACPKNVLDVTPRRWAWFLAGFVVLEALVVILQESFGPRFFMPEAYGTEVIYNYHPPMPASSDTEGGDQNLGDCGICMDTIKIRHRRKSIDEKAGAAYQNLPAASTSAATGRRWFGRARAVRERKTYSLAPCHHLFHTDCLEKWLAIKNICPQCRRPLPPL